MEKINYNYALYTEPSMENDLADWFDTLNAAMSAAREAIENGINPDYVKVMKLYEDGDCVWDFAIDFDDQGRAWSDDYNARDEMGCIQ